MSSMSASYSKDQLFDLFFESDRLVMVQANLILFFIRPYEWTVESL